MRVAAIALMVVCGCGPAKQPEAKDPELAPRTAGQCPATWADVIGSDNGEFCDRADAELTCTYPEGTCACGWPEACDSFDFEGMPTTPTSWQCAWAEGVERTDGCPGGDSPRGQACDQPGQECKYSGECCYEEITCRDQVWELSYGGCPSSPS